MPGDEKALLEKRVEAGCMKQDHITKVVLGQLVRVIGSEALFCRLRDLLAAVKAELARLDDPALIRDEDVPNLCVAVGLLESVEPLGATGAEAAPKVQSPRRCKLGRRRFARDAEGRGSESYCCLGEQAPFRILSTV